MSELELNDINSIFLQHASRTPEDVQVESFGVYLEKVDVRNTPFCAVTVNSSDGDTLALGVAAMQFVDYSSQERGVLGAGMTRVIEQLHAADLVSQSHGVYLNVRMRNHEVARQGWLRFEGMHHRPGACLENRRQPASLVCSHVKDDRIGSACQRNAHGGVFSGDAFRRVIVQTQGPG